MTAHNQNIIVISVKKFDPNASRPNLSNVGLHLAAGSGTHKQVGD